jgi:hypothetical protein
MADSSKDHQKRRRMQRLSASLRDNLKRRKAQARERRLERAASAESRPGEPHDSAGFIDENSNARR